MTKSKKIPYLLPLVTVLAGILGVALQLWLQSANPDSGHYSNDHIANWLLLALTVGVFLFLIIGTWNLVEANKYSFNYPPSMLRSFGCIVGTVALAVFNVGNLFAGGDVLSVITALLGICGAAGLGFIGFCRIQGRHPNFLIHCIIILHLLLQLIGYYRIWSGEPQIQTYAFPLLATVFLMLSVYHNAMFDGNYGNRRIHTLTHLMTVFCCCVCVVCSFYPLIYLCYGFWMLTDLCNLTPMSRRSRKEYRK